MGVSFFFLIFLFFFFLFVLINEEKDSLPFLGDKVVTARMVKCWSVRLSTTSQEGGANAAPCDLYSKSKNRSNSLSRIRKDVSILVIQNLITPHHNMIIEQFKYYI